jgi:hypothetical protein
MEKDKKTTRDHVDPHGNVFTGICTFGVLSPEIIKALDVEDAMMIVVIDKRKRRHLRVSFPTKTLSMDTGFSWKGQVLPLFEVDGSGLLWCTDCQSLLGEPPRIYKRCVTNPTLPPENLGPCD